MNIKFNLREMTTTDAAALIALLVVSFPRAATALDRITIEGAGALDGDTIKEMVEAAPEAAEAFRAPADAAFTAPLATSDADGAVGSDGSSATEPLAAAAAPPPAAPPPASSVELDADGLPWDGRIHGEGKNKTNDGKWRKRRNLKPEVEKQVKAELRAALAAPRPISPAANTETGNAPSAAAQPDTSWSAAAASDASPGLTASSPPAPSSAPAATDGCSAVPPVPASDAAAPPPQPAPVAPAASAAPAPSAPPPPASPAPAPAATTSDAAPSGPVQFAGIMREVTAAQTAGRITAELVTAACQAVGLTGVRDLLPRPDLIPSFRETFESLCTPAAA